MPTITTVRRRENVDFVIWLTSPYVETYYIRHAKVEDNHTMTQ